MAVPILYVTEYSGVANLQPGGAPVAIGNLPPAAQYAVLATTGALLTLAAISSGGAGLVTGTYVNNPVTTTAVAPGGQGGTVSFTVSTAGTAYAMTIFVPGYNYTSAAFINLASGAATTAGAVLCSVHIASVLPCGPPFQANTQLVEISVDANGPALVTLDTTMTSQGYNGVLTTQQLLTTQSGLRLSIYDRIVRGVARPVGANALQAIMGTAAA